MNKILLSLVFCVAALGQPAPPFIPGGGGGGSVGPVNTVQSSNGSGGFINSGCTASSGAMFCTGGYTSSGPFLTGGLHQTTPGSNPPANSDNLFFDSANSDHLTRLNSSGVTSDIENRPIKDIHYVTFSNVNISNSPYPVSLVGNTVSTTRGGYVPNALSSNGDGMAPMLLSGGTTDFFNFFVVNPSTLSQIDFQLYYGASNNITSNATLTAQLYCLNPGTAWPGGWTAASSSSTNTLTNTAGTLGITTFTNISLPTSCTGMMILNITRGGSYSFNIYYFYGFYTATHT